MRISLNWLKEFVDIDVSPEVLADQLTMLGLEIESIERPGVGIENVVVGQILSIDPHPNADKLVVCRTSVGEGEPLQIVCGATNMKPGDKVPTAVVGATLPGDFKIGQRKMRGVESFGMMCSARELGLGEDQQGLLIMAPESPVGADVRPLLGLDDVILEIEVTPNRGDWAGMVGVARELAALYDNRDLRVFPSLVRIPTVTLKEGPRPASELSSVTIEDPDLCPRYCGRVITNIKVGPSPAWMAQRLLSAGMRPINNIVDVTNYVLMETGHPLHAFNYDKLAENRIVVRTARSGETIKTIDGETRNLTPDMLVIADADKPVAVAGVMGGLDSEVGESTCNVFLESAYFHPPSVRKTSRALGLQTEASQRFQRGADIAMAYLAIDRAASLIQQVAGGEIAAGVLDEYPKPLDQRTVTLRFDRTAALLGVDVPADEQQRILEGLGFTVLRDLRQTREEYRSPRPLTVRVPTWRHDVYQEADLIEEIARLHGYGNVPATVPAVKPTDEIFAPQEEALVRLRESLVAMGLTEVMNMSFSSPEEVRRAGLSGRYTDMVMLQNPLAETMSGMRTTFIPGLLTTVARNIRHGSRNIHVFELGPVYAPGVGEGLPVQGVRLGIALTGMAAEKHWSANQREIDFYDLKGYAESILDRFGVSYAFELSRMPLFPEGQGADIHVEGRPLGTMGRVKSETLNAWDLDQPVFLLELELDTLLGRSAPARRFEALPRFPSSLMDLAVVVDADVPAGGLRDTAEKAGGKLLKRVNIFDVYSGKQVPAGKKSVALSLVFQSEERTLTDADTQKTWDRILAELKKTYGAELR